MRVYHHWEKWECVKAGFYETEAPPNVTPDDAREAYRAFLADIPRFVSAMQRVLTEWPHSCEQFLTNTSINRIAWMGQAAMCIETGVPSCFRGGFKLLTPHQQKAANAAGAQMILAWEKLQANSYEKNRAIHSEMGDLWIPRRDS